MMLMYAQACCDAPMQGIPGTQLWEHVVASCAVLQKKKPCIAAQVLPCKHHGEAPHREAPQGITVT